MAFTQISTWSYVIDNITADSRPQILQEHLKRKLDLEKLDDSLPPSFKQHALVRSYAISDLTADSRPQTLQERLKHKSNLETPDDSLSFKRHALVQSYVISDLAADSQSQTLQERLKRKSNLETPDDSLSFKRRALVQSYVISDLAADSQSQTLQECLKHKSNLETLDDSLPPSFKQRTRAQSYAISDLAADSRPQTLQECLKCKSNLETPDDSLPPSFKRHTRTQSYAISDLTAQPISAVYYHSTDRASLQVAIPADFSGYSILTSCWPFPNELTLMIFKQLPVADPRTVTQFCCLSRDIAASLYFPSMGLHIEQMAASQCPRLPSPSISTLVQWYPILFPIQIQVKYAISGLTLTTLRDSPITDLSLTHVALNGIQWATLLTNVHLPLLHMFSIDVECPCAALGDFLARHPNIGQVWIMPGHTPSLIPNVSSHQQHVIPDYHLQNLGVLGGPPWYLLALLAKVHPAHSIQHLSMRFEEDSTPFSPNYLSVILGITQHFISIQELQLSFYGTAHSAEHFEVLDNECCTVPAKNLAISTHCGDDIFLRKQAKMYLDLDAESSDEHDDAHDDQDDMEGDTEDELFLISDHDDNDLTLPTPLQDEAAWNIFEEYLTTHMTFPQIEAKLMLHLGNWYVEPDWAEARNALFSANEDTVSALENLHAIKAQHMSSLARVTVPSSRSQLHPGCAWIDKMDILSEKFTPAYDSP
ncbi:hypothetical protein BD769DRAFT_1669255 [Suillus cothurnatus]|nr:hypothetical protein BD769DRAFT_1669255 [Suillus cothurnatus]